MEECPYAFQSTPHGLLPLLVMSSNTISNIQAILVGFSIEFVQAKLLLAAEGIPSSPLPLRTWCPYWSRKQETELRTKQVVDDLPNQKTVSSAVSMEVVLDLKGGSAPVTQGHSLVACLIYVILRERPVSFELWLLLPFTVQGSLPRRGWQVFLHSTLVETLKKRKKLEMSIRTKWTIAWNPSFRWFPETEMSGFGGLQSSSVLVLYIRKGVHAHWGCWRATGTVLHCLFFY